MHAQGLLDLGANIAVSNNFSMENELGESGFILHTRYFHSLKTDHSQISLCRSQSLYGSKLSTLNSMLHSVHLNSLMLILNSVLQTW